MIRPGKISYLVVQASETGGIEVTGYLTDETVLDRATIQMAGSQ
ncbi:hypothetical protein ACWT_5723 [Actinoplanes sp. SE50]|nr:MULTISPECIES: hypothetical protein [unclassified Actinoplanes]AEV86741.1 hypothetical protein ACPL_5854 [Actinoplanes sp. SE50/110]ATO85138.1 hypothetical protein ACWT_5723 [Actinoplanes sp. SE50]SLM02549.1 hypothetical protein ACSP50_5799 [Actinoplanes sp. SE50/110]